MCSRLGRQSSQLANLVSTFLAPQPPPKTQNVETNLMSATKFVPLEWDAQDKDNSVQGMITYTWLTCTLYVEKYILYTEVCVCCGVYDLLRIGMIFAYIVARMSQIHMQHGKLHNICCRHAARGAFCDGGWLELWPMPWFCSHLLSFQVGGQEMWKPSWLTRSFGGRALNTYHAYACQVINKHTPQHTQTSSYSMYFPTYNVQVNRV